MGGCACSVRVHTRLLALVHSAAWIVAANVHTRWKVLSSRVDSNSPGGAPPAAEQLPLAVLGWDLLLCVPRRRANMESNVTLYWFVLPKWFMDMGGFEQEENIAEFVDWGITAFRLFGENGFEGQRGTICLLCAHLAVTP